MLVAIYCLGVTAKIQGCSMLCNAALPSNVQCCKCPQATKKACPPLSTQIGSCQPPAGAAASIPAAVANLLPNEVGVNPCSTPPFAAVIILCTVHLKCVLPGAAEVCHAAETRPSSSHATACDAVGRAWYLFVVISILMLTDGLALLEGDGYNDMAAAALIIEASAGSLAFAQHMMHHCFHFAAAGQKRFLPAVLWRSCLARQCGRLVL